MINGLLESSRPYPTPFTGRSTLKKTKRTRTITSQHLICTALFFGLSHTFFLSIFSFNFLINQLFFQYSWWCHLKFNLIPKISWEMLLLLFHFSNTSLIFHFSNETLLFLFSIPIIIVSFSSIILLLFHFLQLSLVCFIFSIFQKISGNREDWTWTS